MTNEIAPPADLNIDERIKEVEKFLNEEEKPREIQALTPAPIPTAPIAPITPLTTQIANTEMINLLSRIVQNQNLERMRWERCNPMITDSPVYDFAEETIDPGYMVTFTLTVNEGSVFFFEYFNITYNDDTIYNLYIDGVGPATLPTLTDVLQDFGDHSPFFKPPRLCYQNVIITALNNDDVAHTYSVFLRGWFRQQIKTDKEYLGSR